MTKRTVDHHASVVIVRAGELFFFNGYDAGYPRKEWVGCLSPLGGNYEPGDISPYSLLERELTEEMDNPQKKFKNFADYEADILKEAIKSSIKPYQDFVIVDPIIEKNKNFSRDERSAIISFYESTISSDLMEIAKETIKSGKVLVSEGDGGNVVSLNDLVSGKRNLAWANPFMMNHYLGESIPYLKEGEAEPIGLPRESLTSYLLDFDYIKPINN